MKNKRWIVSCDADHDFIRERDNGNDEIDQEPCRAYEPGPS